MDATQNSTGKYSTFTTCLQYITEYQGQVVQDVVQGCCLYEVLNNNIWLLLECFKRMN